MAILSISINGHEHTTNLPRAVRHCPFSPHPPPSGKKKPKLWKTGHANTGISIGSPWNNACIPRHSGLPLFGLSAHNRGFASGEAKWGTNGWTVKMMSAESARTSFYFFQRLGSVSVRSNSSPLYVMFIFMLCLLKKCWLWSAERPVHMPLSQQPPGVQTVWHPCVGSKTPTLMLMNITVKNGGRKARLLTH